MSSPWLSTRLYFSQSAAMGAATRCGGMPNASMMRWLAGASSLHSALQAPCHGHFQNNGASANKHSPFIWGLLHIRCMQCCSASLREELHSMLQGAVQGAIAK
jgi:hypothetical protein